MLLLAPRLWLWSQPLFNGHTLRTQTVGTDAVCSLSALLTQWTVFLVISRQRRGRLSSGLLLGKWYGHAQYWQKAHCRPAALRSEILQVHLDVVSKSVSYCLSTAYMYDIRTLVLYLGVLLCFVAHFILFTTHRMVCTLHFRPLNCSLF